jgi:DMSO reductase anchor subunit
MHPAPSIIVFTVLSGLGYGLAGVLGLGLLDPTLAATKIAHVLALGLIGAGLLSSTLHLGNPQRAWRAFSQWRSSWLSREGVMSVITFAPLCVSAIAAILYGRYLAVPGLVGTVLCAVTVYCTAMIYASLRSIQTWNTGLTPVCYLLFAGAGGFCLATLCAALGGGAPRLLAGLAALFLVAAWMAKIAWRNRMNTLRPISTPETATGLGTIGKVRLFERPHINDNYLNREMGFKVARKHAVKLAAIALALGGVVPVLLMLALLVAGPSGAVALAIASTAVVAHGLGMLVERWLFFAEAKHAVANYYAR